VTKKRCRLSNTKERKKRKARENTTIQSGAVGSIKKTPVKEGKKKINRNTLQGEGA